MKAIIDLRPLNWGIPSSETADFIIKTLVQLQSELKDFEWVFVMEKSFSEKNIQDKIPLQNLIRLKNASKFFGVQRWFKYQLPRLAKREKADLIITTSGIAVDSNIPQIVWMPKILGLGKEKEKTPFFNFYKKRIDRTLRLSNFLLVSSQKMKMELEEKNKSLAQKIIILTAKADESYHELSWAEKESIKVKYAGGREYFFLMGENPENTAIQILKEFSQFKKRQQSNMQLIFSSNKLLDDKVFTEKLESFKYREDVHVMGQVLGNELRNILSAAYGYIHTGTDDEMGKNVLNAFRAQVPVIAEEAIAGEISKEAILYFQITEASSLANQMMLLYKDEQLRKKTIDKGRAFLEKYNSDKGWGQLKNSVLQIETQSVKS